MDFDRLSVLVVEDEPFALKLTTSVLRQIGMKAIKAVRSGREALEVLEQEPEYFDLVISDCNMPEMTGLNLLRKVRESAPDIRFIMLTANTTGDFVMAARDGGVDGYIVKPFAQAQLAGKIASIFKIKAA